MKEHKSHMSMVARFAYIFATIVTIFGQMGLAPLIATQAITNTSTNYLTTDKTSYSAGDTLTLTVNGDGVENIKLKYDSSKLEYISADAGYEGSIEEGSNYVEINPYDVFTGKHWPAKLTFKVRDNVGKSSTDIIATHLVGLIGTSDEEVGRITINMTPKVTEETNPVTSKPAVNTVTGDILNLASTSSPDSNDAYKLGSEVDLHLNANPSAYPDGYNDIQVEIKELDADGNSTTDYLTFDPDATAKLLRGYGYTVTGPTKSDDYSAYSIKNDSDGSFFNLWVYADHNIRIQWPKGTTGPDGKDLGAWFAMRANKPTDGITMTPYYVGVPQGGGDMVELDSGPATTIKIAKPNGFEGSDYSVDAHSITADDPETKGIVHMNLFPLFYIQDPDDSSLYSFVQNHNAGTQFISGTDGLTAITQYRKSVINNVPFPNSSDPTDKDSVSAGWGGASVTGANLGGTFEDFAKIQSDGQQDTTTLTGFKIGKTYQLKPVRPYGGANSNRFYRIKTDSLFSQHYYMPDGLPTISFDANGEMQIDTKNADGKAKKGQWTVSDDHKKLEASVYKIKYIQVVDDETGAPVDGAKVELTNTDGGEGMKATTKSYNAKNLQSVSTDFKGTGELQPEEYQEDADGQGGPFYLPEGTEHLSSITGLSSEYSAANVKFDMTVDSGTDKITLSNAQNAKLSDDGQTIIVTVHKDVPKNTEVNIQKVAQSDGKALAGANFEVTEKNNTTNDAWTTPSGTTLTSGADGMVPDIKVDGTSSAKTRTFLVKETKAPTGYKVGAVDGYYATWTKGTGFTAVGNTETKQNAKSDDGLASVNPDGTLVIEDPTQALINPGGQASDLKFQYINAAGEPIPGAQLPVLDPTKQYGSNDNLGMTSVGGIIYNPGVTDPTTLMTKDTGLVAGTTLAKDSIMDTSDQKSDENGQGIVQGLWSETGISENWKDLDSTSDAYLLSSAMVNGLIPTVPEMDYSLINEAQQARAKATGASGYYSLGGTVAIGEDAGGKLVAGVATDANKFNANANDNKVLVDETNKTAQVILFKVKHIALTDLNGTPIVGATVHFTNLVTAEPTDPNGEADLVPSTGGADGKAATSFVWPKAKQSFVSATDAEGNKIDLGTDATKYGIWMGNAQSDTLTDTNKSGSTNVATNMTVSDGTKHPTGQFVEMKSTTAQTKTVIRIHKQSMLDPTQSIEGVSFKVWPATDPDTDAAQSSNVVTTDPTNEDGDTIASFDAASTNGKYYIEETDLPDGIFYRQDTKQHLFTADVSGSVSAVDDPDKIISVGTNGRLDFSDMPSAGGGGGLVGDNGTNGGLLTIKKTDLASPTTVVPDGAQFKLTETINNVPTVIAPSATVASGQVQINIGDPTLTTRQFTLQEVTSPLGYSVDGASYPINIAANGTVTVGDPGGTTVSAKVTTNKVLSVNGYVLTFGDQKLVPKDGGIVTIKKVDDTGTTALPNAHFSTITSPVPNLKDGDNPLYAGNMVEDAVTNASGEIQVDLGTAVGSGRIVKFVETQAPNKYALNPAQYNIKQSVDGSIQVAKYESGITPTYSDQTSDGKVSVVDGKVIVKDRKMSALTDLGIKKVDITNTNTVLGGATFTVTKVDASLNPLTSQYTMKTTSDGEALAAITDGSMSGTYSLKETAAPDGYSTDSTTYYFNWESGKGVTAVAGTKVQPTATKVSNSDGATVLSISNGELVFGDKKAQVSTATSFTLKKSDFADSSKGLAGATFKIADATASGVPSGTYNLDGLPNGQPVTTGSDGTVKVTVNPDTSKNYSQWIFAVQETKAPAGYVLNKQIYYVIWTPKDGISGVSTKRGMPTPDEGSGIQLSGGIVNISDVKSPTVTIKKISSVNNAALAGANLTVAEFDKKTNTAYSDIWSDKLTKVNATTQSDGLFKFSPSGAIIGSLHYYKVVEETAPSGFKKGDVAWIVYKMGTGIVGVTSDPSTAEPGTSAGPLSIQNGTVVYTDQLMAYTIQVRRQSAPPTDAGLATLNSIGAAVKINFEDMTDNTGTHTVTADATSGNVTIKASDIMGWLKLDTLPTTGSVKFKISVDADSAKGFTVPIPRYVTFTWGANSGFTVDKTAGKTDAMVTDSTNEIDTKNANTNTLSNGDLRVLLRRDTFIVKSAAADPDTNVIPRVPNAQFVMKYYASTDTTQSPIATSTITTSDKGVALIQAPNLSSDNFNLGSKVTAVLSQETATPGYEKFGSSITFEYNSVAGYKMPATPETNVVPQVIPVAGDPTDGQNDPDSLKYDTNGKPIDPPTSTGVALSLLNAETGVSNQQYYYGGTQIIVPLTKILSSLTLDQAPAVLNFGQAHKSGFQQNLPLLGADASNQATFDTSTLGDEANAAGTKTADAIKSADGSSRTITPQNQQITAKVTQVGQYKAGWQLGLTVGGLTSEAVAGETPEVIDGGTLNLGKPTFTQPTAQSQGSTKATESFALGGDGGALISTLGTESVAGTYTATWNVNQVTMSLPQLSGNPDTSYQAPLTWEVTEGPQQ